MSDDFRQRMIMKREHSATTVLKQLRRIGYVGIQQ